MAQIKILRWIRFALASRPVCRVRPVRRVCAGLASGGYAAEKSPYLTPWSERSGDRVRVALFFIFLARLRPSVWLATGWLRCAPPRTKKSRGLSRGNGSAPGRKILAARYSPAGDSRSTLAVEALNFCVRDGNRCDCLAMVTRKRKTEENRLSENADRPAGDLPHLRRPAVGRLFLKPNRLCGSEAKGSRTAKPPGRLVRVGCAHY